MGNESLVFNLRPARSADVDGIMACVEAAYSPYIERIGRKPGPMLDAYAKVLEKRQCRVRQAGRARLFADLHAKEPPVTLPSSNRLKVDAIVPALRASARVPQPERQA